MEKPITHFEQVPLEVALAILEVEKTLPLEPTSLQLPSVNGKTQSRIERKS